MNIAYSNEQTVGRLVLIDGQNVEGVSFGAKKSMAGEVVFNTGMVGYPEALTDPSYTGQILVLTSPMIGNYGVPPETKDEFGISKFFEGNKIHISGLIVTDYSVDYSHWNAAKSLSQWLVEAGIPALYGVDTRRLTKHIREFGAVLGKIEFPTQEIEFSDPNLRHLVQEVSTSKVQIYNQPNSDAPRIIAFDCGMKLNIVRYFLHELKVCLMIVPYSYNLQENPENLEYDGIFISNGPGDPTMCLETIESIRWAINLPNPKPIFGICLGNQILALACGAKTYKMKYGNRGMNQPCIDLRTTKCFITSQNHGFAVDNDSLPTGWKPLFLNANDLTNEGIIHTSKPFFSCQFHPEAAGGPLDTTFLFQDFLGLVRGHVAERVLVSPSLYDRSNLRKVLLIGSGGLSIGQAGEFDYSGSQAIKALKEEGLEVVLINPNIATVQTSKGLGRPAADKVYFLPIKPHVVEEIIAKERPDGVLVSMGGQTALNVGVELWKAGIFQKYNCRVLGTPIETIIATEDREIFAQKLHSINERLALSYSANTIEEAVVVAHKIGFPVLVRAAFALGGLGSGFADNEEQLRELAEKAFAVSDQILIDQDLRGWKEIEYEVVRDNRDNCITVCNMENFDPLGVHTGDSIVVAPSQTLSNSEYFKLRAVSIKVIRSLGIVGECNIQYALNLEEYCIVEVNARLSRSSALASKATGYPLAYVAAKLCLGKDLVSIRNSINKTTTACFEPSLDYCVVKVPRWDLSKFSKVSTKLGSSMLSVGEVMAIGKTFEEAIQKAVRMVSGGALEGLEGSLQEGKNIEEMLRVPTDKRLFAVQYALERRLSIDEISRLTKIDRWFLSRLKRIADLKAESKKIGSLDRLPKPFIRSLKIAGFSDRQIARYCQSTEQVVRRRRQQLGIIPYTKQIDTLAAEFPAQTNYLYMTYNGSEHDVTTTKESLSTRTSHNISSRFSVNDHHEHGGVMVLGCGAYSIGSSVEFDWCAVSAVRQLRAMGDKAIVVNYNPETVSTDYDESDKLYFEELTLERVLDIYELEKSVGIIVSVGGQIPNNLALPLHQQGVRILGTSPDSIDTAEDRHKFSNLLDRLKIDQPEWKELISFDDAQQFADKVEFPVLVRPSFVLSGAAMRVASTPAELISCLQAAEDVSLDKPVVISKYVVNAKEIEFDAVAQDGHVLNYAISEHVENAGVHSGDATLLLPAQKLYVQTVRTVKQIASQIALSLKITGPFNIQFLAKDNAVRVIECNLRASRTFPFISKTFDNNFITLATKVMMGYPCKPYNISLYDYDFVAVKAPIFSFTRLRGADPTLGVEMSSTGEVACFGKDVHEAFLQALLASNFNLPEKKPDKYILVSIAEEKMRIEFFEALRLLVSKGYNIAATPGTAQYYEQRGFSDIISLAKPPENLEVENDDVENTVLKWIANRKIDLVINIPEGTMRSDELTAGYKMRRLATDFGTSLLTNIKCAVLFCEALTRELHLPCKSADEFVASSQTNA
eukprot:CAMPEP_0173162894 /NCGR_PEP_ID=MMETSP1105-20130129/19587_1 /TAXON_ID=2985 /ORGANISM="Ochromonas sp., Strain BG-1" /LENGTH=1492 /DNA_ID=CAMNT_0014082827 /DNA_START=54 /DNA_END=4533 /DNA_ORIENTATION=+